LISSTVCELKGISVSEASNVTPVSAVEHIRRNETRFFFGGRFSAEEAAGQVATEALLGGAARVEIRHHGAWWIIGGDNMWLDAQLDDASFRTAVPFREGGPNAIRTGIVIASFSSDIVISQEGVVRTIQGVFDPSVHRVLSECNYSAAVAFRPSEAS
jgi:hypothetical protein